MKTTILFLFLLGFFPISTHFSTTENLAPKYSDAELKQLSLEHEQKQAEEYEKFLAEFFPKDAPAKIPSEDYLSFWNHLTTISHHFYENADGKTTEIFLPFMVEDLENDEMQNFLKNFEDFHKNSSKNPLRIHFTSEFFEVEKNLDFLEKITKNLDYQKLEIIFYDEIPDNVEKIFEKIIWKQNPNFRLKIEFIDTEKLKNRTEEWKNIHFSRKKIILEQINILIGRNNSYEEISELKIIFTKKFDTDADNSELQKIIHEKYFDAKKVRKNF